MPVITNMHHLLLQNSTRNNLVDGELDILKFNTEISKAIKQTKDDEIKAELIDKYNSMKQGRRKLNKSNFIEDSKLNEIPESKDLQPHFVYFYDSRGVIQKKGSKKAKYISERKKDFSFISTLYSGKVLDKMVNFRHPSMIKTNSNFFVPRTFIAKKQKTEENQREVLNQSEQYVINNNTSRTIEDEKLQNTDRNASLDMHKFDSKDHSPNKALEKPFTNEFLSTALSPNLQKQK